MKFNGSSLEVWDLAGQKNSRMLWNLYFTGVECIMFIIDSTDKKRIETVKIELQSLLSNDALANVPFCICSNKQDLKGAMTDHELFENLELGFIKSREWQIFKTSGKSGDGIDQAFKWISKQYNQKHNRESMIEVMDDDTEKLGSHRDNSLMDETKKEDDLNLDITPHS